MQAIQFAHKEDPRSIMQRAIGDVSWLRLMGPVVLVATYDPVNAAAALGEDLKTAGGILLPTSDEYKWQGKIGLVLATGPGAFKDSADGRVRFDGLKADVGDWVVYRASDGIQMMLDKFHARVLHDVHVIGTITEPDRIY